MGGGLDRGGIVVGWLVRLCLSLGAVGLVAFDGISVGVTRMAATDDAAAAAAAASAAWSQTRRTERAYAAAVEVARAGDPASQVPRDSFRIAPDGAVHLVVVRRARTIVVEQVTAVRDWALVEAAGSATPTP
jgi:hypothetical protein